MLEALRIRGLGVIDEADLELAPGLTVVTGETGAGKTMVVTALSLLLGARADPGAIRLGADRLQVEGRWRLAPGSAVLERAADAGADVEDDELIAIRSVNAAGRSRAHLGGASVPVGVLASIGENLVDLHSQSDQIALLRPARQLDALDRFARLHDPATGAALDDYRLAYQELRDADIELSTLTAAALERAAERERLMFGLGEIEKVEPADGEDAALAAEATRLAHADDLQAAAATAVVALSGDEGALTVETDVLALLGQARKSVQAMAGHDARLAELGQRLDELAMLAGDLAADLSSYVADTETDPTRLAAIDERRTALAALTRRYGADIDAVLEWGRRAGVRVGELDGSDDRLIVLTAERDGLRARVAELGATLHDGRVRSAAVFAELTGAELRELAMPHARVEFAVATRLDADGIVVTVVDGIGADQLEPGPVAFGPDGIDTVELLLAPHPGAPARPLTRGASGGELSRVMLACHVVLGAGSNIPTYVFDEVDAGVGGSAAVEVGRRLAQLAQHGQVVVVTHLAQVAAFADRHYVVSKNSDGTITSSGLRCVLDDERVAELARMLAGDEASAVSRAHARELLDSAVAPPTGPLTSDVIEPKRRTARRAAGRNTRPVV
ncbi:MAG TPA: DNA repair protein RecN [Actinopolymorphaceae bacterium]|jgi:DNA repair protein RecN (Recombination protein N)